MKKLIAAMAVTLAFCTPAAIAQNTARAAADPAAVAAANELLASMNYRSLATNVLVQSRDAMPAAVRQAADAAIDNEPTLTAAQKKAEHEKVSRTLPQMIKAVNVIFTDPSLVDDLMRETAQLYARHFTVDELRQISAFYTSPVGVKMLASTPQITAEGMQQGQRMMMQRLSVIRQKMPASE